MYDDEHIAQPEAEESAPGGASGSSVSWPTVMMAAGISAIISAIVLAIGMVGLMLSDVGSRATAQEPPATVVNLGAQQGQVPPAAPAAATDAPASEAPTSDVPMADGPLPDVPNPVAPTQQQASQQSQAQTQRAGSPTRPTAAQLQNDLDYLASGASSSQKAQRLEGGSRAVGQAQGILSLAKRFKPMGLTYQIVDPVAVNGNTATARMKLSSPGYQPTYMKLSWVWQDGRWKMTNRSVCDLGAYANIPCNL